MEIAQHGAARRAKNRLRGEFLGDICAIAESDFANRWMAAVDEAAFELGYASAMRKTCIGLQTDVRRLLPIGNNPMLTGALIRIFDDVGHLCAWLDTDCNHKVLRNGVSLQRASAGG